MAIKLISILIGHCLWVFRCNQVAIVFYCVDNLEGQLIDNMSQRSAILMVCLIKGKG